MTCQAQDRIQDEAVMSVALNGGVT